MCGKKDKSLVSLCINCHRTIEFDEDKRRVDLVEKRKVFDQLKKLHRRAAQEGLLLLARVTKSGLWTTIIFEWADLNFEGRLEGMGAVLHAVRSIWQKETRFARHFYSRFHGKTGAKLYLRNTKNVGAILQLKETFAEVKYRADMLGSPLPDLKRTLSKERDEISKCNSEARRRMARILKGGLRRHYRIKIKVQKFEKEPLISLRLHARSAMSRRPIRAISTKIV